MTRTPDLPAWAWWIVITAATIALWVAVGAVLAWLFSRTG